MPEIIKKVWGHEEVLVNNEFYCGKLLKLNKGSVSSFHFHRKKMETFYVQSGRVRFTMDLESRAAAKSPVPFVRILRPGDTVDIYPMYAHRFFGIEDSVIVEFSTHHSDEDVVRLELSVAKS